VLNVHDFKRKLIAVECRTEPFECWSLSYLDEINRHCQDFTAFWTVRLIVELSICKVQDLMSH